MIEIILFTIAALSTISFFCMLMYISVSLMLNSIGDERFHEMNHDR